MTTPDTDEHDELPLDPDVEVARTRGVIKTRPVHLRPSYLGLVGLGGAIGTSSREAITLLVPALGAFPLPIMLINTAGALILGLLLETLARNGPDEGRRRLLRLLLGTGFLGGFTTYSTLTTDTALLLTTPNISIAVGYALGSVILGTGAAAAGIAIATKLNTRQRATA